MSHQSGDEQYIIRGVQGATDIGVGIFARDGIARGRLIMAATSDFSLEQPDRRNIPSMSIFMQYLRLEETAQERYLALCAAKNADLERYNREVQDEKIDGKHISSLGQQSIAGKVVAIFHNNAFGYRDTATGRKMQGMLIEASRFNHSCTPNLSHTWNDELQKRTFRTIREIQDDEELTISYIPLLQRPEARSQSLFEQFGFTCNCNACDESSKFGRLSADRRTQLEDLDLDRVSPVSDSWFDTCKTMIYLLEEEGIHGWEKGEM